MIYPTKIEANGRVYNINTDYRIALDCFRAIDDGSINDTERALAIITLLLGKNVNLNDYEACLEKCAIYLRCGKEENDDIEKVDMDYFQDEIYIKTSIRQCYHLNLNEEKYLHWWEYNELIEGLTEETILNKRRELRNLDLNEIQDEKYRKELKKAQDKIVIKKKIIPLTDKQQESVETFYKLTGIKRKE